MSFPAPGGKTILYPHERAGALYVPSRSGGAGIAHYWKLDENSAPFANQVEINSVAQTPISTAEANATKTSQGWGGDGDLTGLNGLIGSNEENELFRVGSPTAISIECVFAPYSGTAVNAHGGKYEHMIMGIDGGGGGLIRIFGTSGTATLGLNDTFGLGFVTYPPYYYSLPTADNLVTIDQQEHHICLTWADTGVMKIWLDGNLVDTQNSAQPAIPSALASVYLMHSGQPADRLCGHIHHVAWWWNTLLTDADFVQGPVTNRKRDAFANGIARGIARGIR